MYYMAKCSKIHLGEALRPNDLDCNMGKSEHQVTVRGEKANQQTKDFLEMWDLGAIEELLKYLGSMIGQNGSNTPEIQYRCQEARKAFESFAKFFRTRRVPVGQKRLAFTSLIIPVQLYAMETRCLSPKEWDKMDQNLARLGRKLLGASGYGVVNGRTGTWTVDKNHIQGRLGYAACEGAIGLRRLKWFQQLLRTEKRGDANAALVLSSVFGQLVDERLRGRRGAVCLYEDGRVDDRSPDVLRALDQDLIAVELPRVGQPSWEEALREASLKTLEKRKKTRSYRPRRRRPFLPFQSITDTIQATQKTTTTTITITERQRQLRATTNRTRIETYRWSPAVGGGERRRIAVWR